MLVFPDSVLIPTAINAGGGRTEQNIQAVMWITSVYPRGHTVVLIAWRRKSPWKLGGRTRPSVIYGGRISSVRQSQTSKVDTEMLFHC